MQDNENKGNRQMLLKNQLEKFLAVLDSLHKENVDYILIGGFAIVLHGASRFTEDLDIFVRTSEENISRLKKALYSVFQDESINEISATDIKDYAVIRYGSPDDFYIDIIGNPGETFSIDSISSRDVDVEGITIRIATPESLYKLKEKTFRAIDRDDLIFLAEKMKREHKSDKKI